MRKAVLHAEGRACKADGCATILSVYNPGKTCSVHPEVMTTKEARRALVVESTDKEKDRMRRYKARVRAGIVKPKRRLVKVAYPTAAVKFLDKAIAKSMKRVNAEVAKAMMIPARYLKPDKRMTAMGDMLLTRRWNR